VSDSDAVVTSANFLIDAESNLKAALKSFGETGAAASQSDAATPSGMGGQK
jgi:Cu(I)/Ag(I) efflux system membrane fusion protein